MSGHREILIGLVWLSETSLPISSPRAALEPNITSYQMLLFLRVMLQAAQRFLSSLNSPTKSTQQHEDSSTVVTVQYAHKVFPAG